MNLFVLSLNFKECAEAMFDKHVSKMLLEAVQMLCTAKQLLDPFPEGEDPPFRIYKISHQNHPVSIWIRTSLENYIWTLNMVFFMHQEWKYRYGHSPKKIHASYLVARNLCKFLPPADRFPQTGLTPFAQAMPDEYRVEGDAVAAYRRYYQSPDKRKIATWKNRSPPSWYKMQNDVEDSVVRESKV